MRLNRYPTLVERASLSTHFPASLKCICHTHLTEVGPERDCRVHVACGRIATCAYAAPRPFVLADSAATAALLFAPVEYHATPGMIARCLLMPTGTASALSRQPL